MIVRILLCLVVLLLPTSPAFSVKPWKLVWADEFNTNGPPSPANWNYKHSSVRNQEGNGISRKMPFATRAYW